MDLLGFINKLNLLQKHLSYVIYKFHHMRNILDITWCVSLVSS